MGSMRGFFALHRPEPNIAAAEAVGPSDAVDGLVGARLRLTDGLAERADVEHAAAVGEDAGAVGLAAAKEDFDAFDFSGCVEPFDDRAFGVAAGITLRG